MAQQTKRQQIRACLFELEATEGTANIKFPCSFFIEWKTSNTKNTNSSKNRRKALSGKIAFNETLELNTNMIYDNNSQAYLKRQSIIMVNLISNSRPNQPKLVGRVVVDLDGVANGTSFQQLNRHSLEYCSVDGSLTFKVTLKEQTETALLIRDLQKSQISEFESVLQEKKYAKEQYKTENVSFSKSVLPLPNKEKIASRIIETRTEKLSSLKTDRLTLNKSQQEKVIEVKSSKKISVDNQIVVEVRQQQKQIIKIQNAQKHEDRSQKYNLNIPVLSSDNHQFDSSKKSEKRQQNSERSSSTIVDKSIIQGQEIFVSIQQPTPAKPIQSSIKHQITLSGHESTSNAIQTSLQDLKQQIHRLKLQNEERIQLSSLEYTEKIQEIENMRIAIFNKDEELKRISQADYVGQINSLTKILEEQKLQIQQFNKREYKIVVQTTYIQQIDSLRKIQTEQKHKIDQLTTTVDKTKELSIEIAAIRQTNTELLEENGLIKRQLSQKISQIAQIQRFQQYNQEDNARTTLLEDQVNRFKLEQQETFSKLSTEIQNHENTKVQLVQMRQWYGQIQQQSNRLKSQKQTLLATLEQFKGKQESYLSTIYQLEQQKDNANKQSANAQIKYDTIALLQQQLSGLKDQLKLSQGEVEHYKERQIDIKNKSDQTQVRLDEIQLRYLELTEQLKLEKDKAQELQSLLKEMENNSKSKITALKIKEEEIQMHERKTNDLIRRLKDKEETISKLEREYREAESKWKRVQFVSEQNNDQLRLLEEELNIQGEKNRTLQKENRQLKDKFEKDTEVYERQAKRLKRQIEEERTKAQQLLTLQTASQSKTKNTETKRIRELELALQRHEQKQKMMKQNLNLLEYQSNSIAQILHEKQENQEKLKQAIFIVQGENTQFVARLQELENMCQLLNQRNQGLASQLQLLSNYNSNDIDTNQMAELNKRLMDKNKDLLQQLQTKNSEIASKTKIQGELKGQTAERLLSNSRFQKQKLVLQQQLTHLKEINQKWFKQYQNLNIKLQTQTNQKNQNKQKISEYQAQIQQLHSKITEKELQAADIEIQKKEELENILERISEKDIQSQYYQNQINQLNYTIQNLNSDVGEKQVQICSSEIKLEQAKQLNDQQIVIINSLKGQLDNWKSNPSQINETSSPDLTQLTESQRNQIAQLQLKNLQQKKELQTQTEEFAKIKERFNHQLQQVETLYQEIKIAKDSQSYYLNKISEIEQQSKWRQNQFNQISTENSKNEQQLTKTKHNLAQLKQYLSNYEKDSATLKAENELLKQQIQQLKEEKAKASIQNTPIMKINETSPSPTKKQNINITQILTEINEIVTRRKQEDELENTFRLVIDNNARQEEEFQRWGRERGFIQEKAKLASKEIQKVKSTILKTTNRNIAQKTQIINLLKPAEVIVNELIHLSQTLAEMNLQYDPEQQFEDQLSSNKRTGKIL